MAVLWGTLISKLPNLCIGGEIGEECRCFLPAVFCCYLCRYFVLCSCWALDARKRPSFSQLLSLLACQLADAEGAVSNHANKQLSLFLAFLRGRSFNSSSTHGKGLGTTTSPAADSALWGKSSVFYQGKLQHGCILAFSPDAQWKCGGCGV